MNDEPPIRVPVHTDKAMTHQEMAAAFDRMLNGSPVTWLTWLSWAAWASSWFAVGWIVRALSE